MAKQEKLIILAQSEFGEGGYRAFLSYCGADNPEELVSYETFDMYAAAFRKDHPELFKGL